MPSRLNAATIHRARTLRLDGIALRDIADELGIALSTAHRWTADLPGPPRELWRPAIRLTKGRLHEARLADLADAEEWASDRLATLSDDAFFAGGVALYVGEGHKRDGAVGFTNTNPDVVAYFLRWLRRYFDVEEERLRAHLYLHEGLDLDAAVEHWSRVTRIPSEQFGKPYRAVADPSIRTAKHVNGCLTVRYSCSTTHRKVMALARRLLSSAPVDPA